MIKELIKKLSLRVPEIRRLLQERDYLKTRCNLLEQEKAKLEKKQEHLLDEVQLLESKLKPALEWSGFANYYLGLKEQNKLIETDYSYFPKSRNWQDRTTIIELTKKIEKDFAKYQEYLQIFADYEAFFNKIPVHFSEGLSEAEPYWVNGWIPGLDAISLYGLVAEKKPRYYVEVGSGNSTRFVRKAINDQQLSTKIISIDPYPRAAIDAICDQVIRHPLEEVDNQFFASLSEEDILFVDNSHRSFSNSDVTVFFLEILGALPPGMIYGIHDIFLPLDYPEPWQDRYYNEQYLLATYLMGGADGDEIILPNAYLAHLKTPLTALDKIFQNPALVGIEPWGGIFWMRKGFLN